MSKQTLNQQLAALVGDFGYADVRKTLSDIRRTKARPPAAQKTAKRPASGTSLRKKPNAVAVVNSLNIAAGEKRDYLEHLAREYDAKQFMPDVGHARMFLENESIFALSKNSRIKSRQQATVKIFKKMAGMTVAELRELEYCGLYDPPKRLETYARAIETFGRHLRDSRQKTSGR